MDAESLDVHLAFVYDWNGLGSRADGDTHQLVCPRRWHIWAAFSDQQILRFNSLTTLPPSESVAPMYISFQRIDTLSRKLKNTDVTNSRLLTRDSTGVVGRRDKGSSFREM